VIYFVQACFTRQCVSDADPGAGFVASRSRKIARRVRCSYAGVYGFYHRPCDLLIWKTAHRRVFFRHVIEREHSEYPFECRQSCLKSTRCEWCVFYAAHSLTSTSCYCQKNAAKYVVFQCKALLIVTIMCE